MSNNLSQLLRAILEQLPSLLTIFVCIVISIVRWKRHPKVSLVVMISLFMMFFDLLLFAFIYAWVPEWLMKTVRPSDIRSFSQNLYLVLAVMSNGAVALGLVLLLVGVFMQRKLHTPT